MLELDQQQAVARRAAACRSAPGSPRRSAVSPSVSASDSSRWGLPTSALSAAGVPSATSLPPGDDPDPVGELVGLLQVLGGEEDGGALVVQLRDLLPDRLAADRVEAGGRLVEEEDRGLVNQRRGEVEAAAHAARVGADAPVGGLRQPDAVEQRVAELAAPARGHGVQRRLQVDQLAAGHQGVERGLLERDPDLAPHGARVRGDVVPRDDGPAARGRQQRGQHPHRGRLAGAVGAEEAVDLAVGDLEVDPVHRLDARPRTRARAAASRSRPRAHDSRRGTRPLVHDAGRKVATIIETGVLNGTRMGQDAQAIRTPASPRRAFSPPACSRLASRSRVGTGDRRGGAPGRRARGCRPRCPGMPDALPGARAGRPGFQNSIGAVKSPFVVPYHGQDRRVVDQARRPREQTRRRRKREPSSLLQRASSGPARRASRC